MPINELVATRPRSFDLVIISDVLHHVPPPNRTPFLSMAGSAVCEGGALVLKEWARSSSPVHWVSYFCDRYITGDRVHFENVPVLTDAARSTLPEGELEAFWRNGPWANNVSFLVRAPSQVLRSCGESRAARVAAARQTCPGADATAQALPRPRAP
jgi:2-polyprenyl-6-hydroxyphenyl methylase/3-demethylubiquinone-9 3-methyltransferase